jgi:hypothetical protein
VNEKRGRATSEPEDFLRLVVVALIGEVAVVANMADWFEVDPEYQPDNQKVIALPDMIYSQRELNRMAVTVCTISVFL